MESVRGRKECCKNCGEICGERKLPTDDRIDNAFAEWQALSWWRRLLAWLRG